ncbi:MAG: hypothetical protein H5T24_02785 [Bacteroidales bacterium]|nr:hypothetical protein [Bacteroidales bacterium]
MEPETQKRVLLSPLAWGLGHATRIIPVIHELSHKGYTITVATNNELGALINNNCPYSEIINFYSPKMKLGTGKASVLNLLSFLVKLPFVTIIEHIKLKRLLKGKSFTLLVSDNRYGFRSSKTKSIIITHQLRVIPPKPFGFVKCLGEYVIRHLLSRFDEVWVPDFNNASRIAGMLSEPNGLTNLRYLGPISRFYGISPSQQNPQWEVMVIASGPEPQKTEFINILTTFLDEINLKTLIVKGNPFNTNSWETHGNFTFVGSLSSEEMATAIVNTKFVISRSGYSTIMDLVYLNKGGILIPTPGQTEQEYLAHRMNELGWFKTVYQKDLSKELLLALLDQTIPTPPRFTPNQVLAFIE